MKKLIILIFIFTLTSTVFSQSSEKVIFTINKDATTVGDFKRVYEKNLDAITDSNAKDVVKNLDLFVNYKLKVKEAYHRNLDTLASYKREMNSYKNQLVAPYLKDTTALSKLVEEAYFRTKNEVKAKHILIKIPRGALPKDTLIAYQKILAIRDRIVKGESFEKVAVETSDDSSAKDDPESGRKGNKGNLGYFSAFRMIYPFESVAYKTKEGEISLPFRTRFGYHIVKNEGLRKSSGSLEAAHILIRDTSNVGKKKIDKIYSDLQVGMEFSVLAKEFSEDPGSKNNGGLLGKFSKGQMVKPFEDAVFSLKNEDTYSAPFKTRFGWHIAKLVKKHPVPSFEVLKEELKNRVKRSAAIQTSEKALLNRIKKQYSVKEYQEAKEILNKKNIRGISKDSLQSTLFSIDEKKIIQEEFVDYTKNRRHKPIYVLYEEFFNQELINYYKEDLVNLDSEYAATLKEYEEGLLLFELMQKEIWTKASKDSLGIQKFYNSNIRKYNNKPIASIKGQVINDYQDYLDQKLISDLRKKYKVVVKKKPLKKLIKYYRKEN